MVILEEGNLPHPWCPLCDILVPWKALNRTHMCMAKFTRVMEQKRRRLEAEEEREFTVRAFSTYGSPLDMVTSFKYLGQVISATDDDWPAVVRNLAQENKVWSRMSCIISREVATPWVSGLFFKAVIQVLLIF